MPITSQSTRLVRLLFCVVPLLAPAGFAVAAELGLEQVREHLRSASAASPADLAGKDLSDLDLSGLDFRNARLQGTSFFGSKLVNSDSEAAICVRPTSMAPG